MVPNRIIKRPFQHLHLFVFGKLELMQIASWATGWAVMHFHGCDVGWGVWGGGFGTGAMWNHSIKSHVWASAICQCHFSLCLIHEVRVLCSYHLSSSRVRGSFTLVPTELSFSQAVLTPRDVRALCSSSPEKYIITQCNLTSIIQYMSCTGKYGYGKECC